jgi:hypothetical protein
MADDIDIAQERIEADMAHRIATRTVYTGISAKHSRGSSRGGEGREGLCALWGFGGAEG